MDDILHMRKEDTAKNGGLPAKEELDRSSKVLMFIWRKMCDQSKNMSQTFKIFDTRDKGKLRKTDFTIGLDKYQIQLSKDDQDAAWDALDTRKSGFVTFEEFSRIHKSEKQKYMDDPYLSNQIQSHIHESLAQERKKERDRLAQELIETMSSKLGSASAYNRYSEKDRGHGIGQLPSDDINELMHNNYNKMYVQTKKDRDQYVNQMRIDHKQQLKVVRDTHANKLKADTQQKLARDLHDQANSQYGDKVPIRFNENMESLPPLQHHSSRTAKSVTNLSGATQGAMNKYVKKNQLPIDI